MAETVTIVLSNYNHGRYLPESLRNICEQTRPADKILVIDDGSTDNSVQEISKFEAQYSNLRMIRNPTNIGLQASIEKVMPLVVTDCMVWSASDDILLPNFLEKSMAALERHPNAGMCFSELTVLKGDTGVVQRFATEPSVAHIYDLQDLPEFIDPATVCARMRRSYFPPTSNSVVVRMWALKSVGYFRPELEWHSDWLTYNAVAIKFGSCVIAETLAHIREREDSYSAEGRREPRQQSRVLSAMLDVIAEPGFEDVKSALEKNPSYYSVWGAEILPIMRRRPAFWRTYLNFRYWLLREKNRANGLSWKRWLLSKIPLIRIGVFNRPVAPPQPINLINQLRAEHEEMRTQRESAKHQRDLLNGHLAAMQTQRDNVADQLTSMQKHMQGLHDKVAKKYEAAHKKSTELSSQLGKLSREFETVVSRAEQTEQKLETTERELQNLKTKVEADTSAWGKEKEAFRIALAEKTDEIDAQEIRIEELENTV
ncbi:MAG: glycosyltransferase, partial [Rhodospirillales bacterium]|nr:glycosyltransferase [Rhodospirillales bacterium]